MMSHANPLQRFLSLAEQISETKGMFDDTSALRYAALAMITADGSPAEVVLRMNDVADRLKRRVKWYSSLNTSIRFVVAAQLVRYNDDPDRFCDAVEGASALLKEVGLSRLNPYTSLAVLILRGEEHRSVDRPMLTRVKAIYDEMKRHHPWITDSNDLPTCAILSWSAATPEEISARVERLYTSLHEEGFTRGDSLQAVSHLLFFNEATDFTCVRRFKDLYERFRAKGLWMHSGDYDEIAYLTYLDETAEVVIARVMGHRARIEELRPRPSKDFSFSLACNTALLDLMKPDEKLERVTNVQALRQVQQYINAQQAG